MKRSILLLINGFGVERGDSYSVYSPEVMPNMDRIRNEKLFQSIPNKYLDYKSAYRNFSMGINDPLTYSLIETNINNNEYVNNELFKYIISQAVVNKSRLHLFCFWDSEKTIEQLFKYLEVIKRNNISRIFLHIVLCQKSIFDYKDIERGLNQLNYDSGANIKIGVVTGVNNFNNILQAKDLVKNFMTEFGEKWKDLSKKVDVLFQNKTIPSDARTFSVNPTYRFENNDQILFFNYSSVDLTMFRKELFEQKFREVDFNTIKFYSLFPLKAGVQLPFMYNYVVSADYTLDSLKKANVKCLVLDKKENCSYINYYLTGLRNTVDDNLKYIPTDDGFIYDANKLIETINNYNRDFYIINYDITGFKSVDELKAKLKQIDDIIGVLDNYIRQNNYSLFISSLYGLETQALNPKQELVKINFSGKAPVVVDDNQISSANHSISPEGSLYDLCNSIITNINPEFKVPGLLKKKIPLFSFLYKKPKEVKEVKNNEQAGV